MSIIQIFNEFINESIENNILIDINDIKHFLRQYEDVYDDSEYIKNIVKNDFFDINQIKNNREWSTKFYLHESIKDT